jgi:hypothetical protein
MGHGKGTLVPETGSPGQGHSSHWPGTLGKGDEVVEQTLTPVW